MLSFLPAAQDKGFFSIPAGENEGARTITDDSIVKEWDKTISRNYYIWAVQGGGRTIVFDSGVRPALAAERKLAGYVLPDQALARIGIDAKKVEHLVISTNDSGSC